MLITQLNCHGPPRPHTAPSPPPPPPHSTLVPCSPLPLKPDDSAAFCSALRDRLTSGWRLMERRSQSWRWLAARWLQTWGQVSDDGVCEQQAVRVAECSQVCSCHNSHGAGGWVRWSGGRELGGTAPQRSCNSFTPSRAVIPSLQAEL